MRKRDLRTLRVNADEQKWFSTVPGSDNNDDEGDWVDTEPPPQENPANQEVLKVTRLPGSFNTQEKRL